MMQFPNEASEFVYIRSYARWLEDEGRRETWEETVDRYVEFIEKHVGDKVPQRVFKKVREKILAFEVMPSMRALWAAGPAAEATNTACYNCAFSAIDSIESFAECLYILMCGAGYGFSVEEQFVKKLPTVGKLNGKGAGTFVVEDSKEGWADSVKHLMTALYAGNDLELDTSRLRSRGARLKTFGGRSSGPAPLISLHEFIREKFQGAQGRKLTSLECLDILNKIAEIVVVGGVRRSSQISLSDLDNHEVATAKHWPYPLHRGMSNNSAVYDEKPGAIRFLEEWSHLAKSGTGERGIFNRQGAKKRSPDRRDSSKITGVNPCAEILLRSRQFCVHGDTELITEDGIHQIRDVVGRRVRVWNGEEWSSVVPRKTGSNQRMVQVGFSDGSSLICTPDHRFSVKDRFQKSFSEVKAEDLMSFSKYSVQVEPASVVYEGGRLVEDAYDVGFAVGDGCVYKGQVIVDLYGEKDTSLPLKGKRRKEYLPKGYNVSRTRLVADVSAEVVASLKTHVSSLDDLFSWSRDSILKFVAGWLDADGTETGTGGVRLYLSGRERAIKMQLLLTKCGIRSSVCLCQKKGEKTNLSARRSDLMYLQITDCKDIPTHRLDTSKGHRPRFKGKYQTVVSVTSLKGRHDSFCFVEEKRHKAVFGNVLTHQCNLSEVVIRATDDLDDVLEKIETAAWLGAIQSTFTKFPYLSKKWKKNCEEERLLGVSLTGQMDNPSLFNEDALKAMKSKAVKVAKKAAKVLGINVPTAVTCVKPSGTVSQLVNSASGLHPRYSKFYIRRYRIASMDSLFKMLQAQGINMTPEVGQRESDWGKDSPIYEKGKRWSKDKVHTWVIEFPVEAPKTSKTRDDFTAKEQLEYYKRVQEHWCEHNASCTVYVDDHEWFEVGNWVYRNWKQVTGVSFLPKDGGLYELSPFEEISEKQYEKLKEDFPKIDYSQLSRFELEDSTEGSKELACSGGLCEI